MRFACFCALASGLATGAWWSVQSTGVESNLRGVCVLANYYDESNVTIWANGSNGTILRSTDAGKHWGRLHIPDGDTLDFRGVRAIDRAVAFVMSSGDGDKSRIYKTKDGGKSWQEQYTDRRKGFFLDALACSDDRSCFALSDPVDGKFLVLQTEDGLHWSELPREHMPAALPGEGAFAASNSSLFVEEHDLYFGTGGPAARVFHSPDLGKTWAVSETPIVSGKVSAGIFSIVGRGSHLVVVGGDFQDPTGAYKNAAVSDDDGQTWQLAVAPPGGYRSAVARYNGGYVAVGPNGTEISGDGLRWQHTDSINLNAVSFEIGQGWAVGPKGSVAHFIDHNQYQIHIFEASPLLGGQRLDHRLKSR